MHDYETILGSSKFLCTAITNFYEFFSEKKQIGLRIHDVSRNSRLWEADFMGSKDYVEKLINPKDPRNWLVQSAKGYGILGQLAWSFMSGRRSASTGSLVPDIQRGSLRFPGKGSVSQAGDIWNFYRAVRDIENKKVNSQKHESQATVVEAAITSLHAGIQDETLIWCRPGLENTGIQQDANKPHRLTLRLNPDNVDDFVAILQNAQNRQELFRRGETRQDDFMLKNHAASSAQHQSLPQQIEEAIIVMRSNVASLENTTQREPGGRFTPGVVSPAAQPSTRSSSDQSR